MKVYLLKASAPGPFKEYKKYMGSPPQNIFAAAACTPKGVTIDMCDETSGMKPKKRPDADIIAMFFHTPDAVHAYRMAAAYRKQGKTVVMAGLHPSFMPNEALRHCDAVLVGEIEGIWTDMLRDFKRGRLQKRYERTEPVDMATLKPYPTNIIPPSRYGGVWSVMVSRGCPHRCEFCVVPPFFKGKYRLRPVDDVVAEIKAAPTDWFELHADNLTANRDYAVELFTKLAPLNINWVGESTIKMAEDDELLKLAQASGCRVLLIGIETPSQAALKTSGKGFVSPDQIKDRVRRFHDHGIKITSSMIFGFDSQTKDIFRESVEFCEQIEIDEVEAAILTPFAGTPLYKRMKEEGRLLTDDWSKYDCDHAVFKPKNMTAKELEEGRNWFWMQMHKKLPSGGGGMQFDDTPAPKGAGGSSMSFSLGGLRWKSILALLLIFSSIIFEAPWLWGVLFLIWAVKDLKTGRTYLLEDIPRSESPFLYWIIVIMWLCFTVSALTWAPIIRDYVYYGETAGVLDEPIKHLRKKAEAIPLVKTVTEKVDELRDTADSITGKVITDNASAKQATPAPAPKPTKEVRRSVQQPAATKPVAPQPAPKPAANTRTISNAAFDLSMQVPAEWKTRRSKVSGGIQLDTEAPGMRASISCVAMNMGKRYRLGDFISLMERELESSMPFMRTAPASKIDLGVSKINGTPIEFREYVGNLQGVPIRAVIGYLVDGNRGYSLIAVHGKGDSQYRKDVEDSLRSFKLDR